MDERMLSILRCPVTGGRLRCQIIARDTTSAIQQGILWSEEDWFFPIINGIPRLLVEAFIDYADFLRLHMADYETRCKPLEEKYPGLLAYVKKKNKKTKQSFSVEWSLYDYEKDRTWDATEKEMLLRFLQETSEQAEDLKGKWVLDAGCGNGHLDMLIAAEGVQVVAMDLSHSIERAYQKNSQKDVWFIQGDVQFPPLRQECFDIVHCSGVLHHTNNTELSFSCLCPFVHPGGKLSIWLYQPVDSLLHRLFNWLRRFTRRLPIRTCRVLLACTALPISYVWKRLKGNTQNKREMMIDLMDWFSPEFRREHTPDEAAAWYTKRGYQAVKMTTQNSFGFNMIGTRPSDVPTSMLDAPTSMTA